MSLCARGAARTTRRRPSVPVPVHRPCAPSPLEAAPSAGFRTRRPVAVDRTPVRRTLESLWLAMGRSVATSPGDPGDRLLSRHSSSRADADRGFKGGTPRTPCLLCVETMLPHRTSCEYRVCHHSALSGFSGQTSARRAFRSAPRLWPATVRGDPVCSTAGTRGEALSPVSGRGTTRSDAGERWADRPRDMPTWQDGESAHALVAARLGVDDRLPACTPWDWRGARRSRHDGRSDDPGPAHGQDARGAVGPARGQRGRRPRPRPHRRVAAPRAHRGRDRLRHRRGARRGGARARRLRHRRLRPPRGEPPTTGGPTVSCAPASPSSSTSAGRRPAATPAIRRCATAAGGTGAFPPEPRRGRSRRDGGGTVRGAPHAAFRRGWHRAGPL